MRRHSLAAVAALALAACAQNGPPKADTSTPPTTGAARTEVKEPEVTLQAVKWPELEKAIAAHKGKVVVLDVWAEY